MAVKLQDVINYHPCKPASQPARGNVNYIHFKEQSVVDLLDSDLFRCTFNKGKSVGKYIIAPYVT